MAGWIDITLRITKEINKCSLQYFVTVFTELCKQSELLEDMNLPLLLVQSALLGWFGGLPR